MEVQERSTPSFISIVVGIYFILLPFETVFPSESGSILKLYSYLILAISVIVIVKQRYIYKTNMDICFKLFMIIALGYISTIWSIDVSTTISRNNRYALLYILLLLVCCLPIKKNEIRIVEHSYIFGAVLVCLYAIINYSSMIIFKGRMLLNEGTDANGFAAVLLVPLVLAVKQAYENNRIRRVFYIIVSVLIFAIALMTGSRGFLLATCICIFTFYLQVPGEGKIKGAIGLITLFVVSYYVIERFLPAELLTRFTSIDGYMAEYSVNSRQNIWKAAIEYLFNDGKILGYGTGCGPIRMIERTGEAHAVHNTYLNLIMELGILGLPFLVSVIVSIIKRLRLEQERWTIIALMGILTCIFFLDAFTKKYFWAVLMYCMIVINAREN